MGVWYTAPLSKGPEGGPQLWMNVWDKDRVCLWLVGVKTARKKGILKGSTEMCQSALIMQPSNGMSIYASLYVCLCDSQLTCNFQCTLRGVCDGGGDSHRWVSSFLQHISLTQALGFLQFPLHSFQAFPLCPCLFPFIGWLETSCIVDAAALALAAGFGVVGVPGQTILHQRSLLCIRPHLGTESRTHAKRDCSGIEWVTDIWLTEQGENNYCRETEHKHHGNKVLEKDERETKQINKPQ